jgi:hypothetical protein
VNRGGWIDPLCTPFPPVQILEKVAFRKGIMERLMHPLFEKANSLTENIIASAIEVHRHFGPGLLESVYEWALTKELELRGYKVESQRQIIARC